MTNEPQGLSPRFFPEISKDALCGFLENGSGAMEIAAYAAIAWDQNWAGAGLATIGLGFEALAGQNGCQYNPEPPEYVYEPTGDCRNCCSAALSGGKMYAYSNGQKIPQGTQIVTAVSKVQGPYSGPDPNTNYWSYTYVQNEVEINASLPLDKSWPKPCVCIEDIEGDGLCDSDDDDEPLTPPYEFTDPTTGCIWTVFVVDSYLGPDGLPVLKYRAESNNPTVCGPAREWWSYPDGTTQPIAPDTPETPEPTPVPTPSPDGGPPPTRPDGPDKPIEPLPPDEPEPPPPNNCCETVRIKLQQLAKAVSIIDQNLRAHMENMQKIRVPDAEAAQFTAACNKDENGELLSVDYTLIGAQGLFPMLQALSTGQNEVITLLNQHLQWETPICSAEASETFDTRVTVRFNSTTYSSNGNNVLRKQLTYFSGQDKSLDYYAGKWADFTWKSGPAIVQHVGTKLGKPKVFAETPDEAKRVIRKVFEGEGIDPDTEGEWKVRQAASERFGEVKTMVTYKRGEYVWVTKRDGSSGFVELALDS